MKDFLFVKIMWYTRFDDVRFLYSTFSRLPIGRLEGCFFYSSCPPFFSAYLFSFDALVSTRISHTMYTVIPCCFLLISRVTVFQVPSVEVLLEIPDNLRKASTSVVSIRFLLFSVSFHISAP